MNGVPLRTPTAKPFGYNESTEFLSGLRLKSPFGYNELTEFLSGLRVESLGLQMNKRSSLPDSELKAFGYNETTEFLSGLRLKSPFG
jgi:hypothetical protein